jgi:hypothetical protein
LAVYRNCNVGLLQQIETDSGVAGVGYGFSILSDYRPIVEFSFATEDDALQAWVEMKRAVARVVELRAQS